MMPLIFERKSKNSGDLLPSTSKANVAKGLLPQNMLRKIDAGLPEVCELDVVRHFTELSQKNFCVDTNFYPLGSCTMKYNPKVNDQITSWPFYARIHPYQREDHIQGMLEIVQETEAMLGEITGMDAFSLQPAAGAQGEFAGLLMCRAYHDEQGSKRNNILIPDSAHGTNPASAQLCGYDVVQVKTDAEGRVDIEDLRNKADQNTACLMLTNPNTLGIFEKSISDITSIMHGVGSLVYYDGANMNALMGIAKPGDMGFDIVHVNLHKTFAVPHGSGGPGSGPVGVCAKLEKYLPYPRLKKTEEGLIWDYNRPESIGRLRSFYGNPGAFLRSYCYIKALGREGLKEVSESAVLNANYLKAKLAKHYAMPHDAYCMHEFVCSAKKQKVFGVKALDIAKRLLDYGIHAPTIYFPLIVEEAMMIEPTETESKQTLDRFIQVMIDIAEESEADPESLLNAPTQTPITRIDEVTAARKPNIRWNPDSSDDAGTQVNLSLKTTTTCCT
ncbi:MAG: glycine dehydrogenase subunit 2 [Candidatus Omnitrophota bacterium]|jgi:glycine dehydrogenase subunit 2